MKSPAVPDFLCHAAHATGDGTELIFSCHAPHSTDFGSESSESDSARCPFGFSTEPDSKKKKGLNARIKEQQQIVTTLYEVYKNAPVHTKTERNTHAVTYCTNTLAHQCVCEAYAVATWCANM